MTMICNQDMKLSSLLILMLSTFCAFSQIPHELTLVLGCFDNGITQSQFEFDAEEVLYVDFEGHAVVYTAPKFLATDPREIFDNMHLYKDAVQNKIGCSAALALFKTVEHPPEEKDPPEVVLYTSEEAQLGAENNLICFMNHFYPPDIKVNWTKNGHLVSEGVSLSRYYPDNDQTFHQFSTLTFTPREGDIYTCSVEHSALEKPITRFWEPEREPEPSPSSLGADILCGAGLTLGLLGVGAGTFLMVKRPNGQ